MYYSKAPEEISNNYNQLEMERNVIFEETIIVFWFSNSGKGKVEKVLTTACKEVHF